MKEDFIDYLKNKIQKLNIVLSETESYNLYSLFEHIIEKNKKINLTAISEVNDFIDKNIIDSLTILYNNDANQLLYDKKRKIVDVGTGAGFPGLVLNIVFQQNFFLLNDCSRKRLDFIDEFISETGLKNIITKHSRAEDLGHNNEYREKFDMVVSRAVAKIDVLLEYCMPLLKNDGIFIAYKTPTGICEIEEAKNAARKLGAEFIKSDAFMLPGTDINRALFEYKKIQKTPNIYPRKAGTPVKNPL